MPLTAYTAIDPAPLRGRTMLDTSNYYPFRDGRVAALDDEKLTTSELLQRHFDGVALVNAFNNILAHHIPQLARPSGAPDRTALPIAGDDGAAKAEAAALIDRLRFDTVDAGPLADSWRFEPEAAAYTRLYLAEPTTPDAQVLEASAGPVSAADVQSALDEAHRVRVADRTSEQARHLTAASVGRHRPHAHGMGRNAWSDRGQASAGTRSRPDPAWA